MDVGSLDKNTAPAGKPVIRPSLSALFSRDFSPCGPERIRIRLPVGIADADGRLVREAWVEPLDGRAEVSSERAGRSAGFIQWVTSLISYTTSLEGNFSNEHPAARLSVADRDMLALALRMLTFGPEIWGIVQCPNQECESLLDVSFDLTGVEVPSGNKGGQTHTETVERGPKKIRFKYREPNGSDQEAVAGLVCSDPRKAQGALLSRCLIEAEGIPDLSADTLAGLPEDLLNGIDKAISQGMTSFDWDLEIACSECARHFISTLDIQAFFWEELHMTKEDFWNEVHQLAFYYHWPESEILSLSRWRRKMYLNHIRRHLGATVQV